MIIRMEKAARAVFWVVLAACLAPIFFPSEAVRAAAAPLALVLGITVALTLGNPYPALAKKGQKVLLQAAVILLGFSMELPKVVAAGLQGALFGLVSILAVFGLGWLLCRWLNIRPLTSLLVSTGTAICGGSAIAAMSSVTDAPQEDVLVAVGTVFLLNAVGLLIFPPLGHALGLTPSQFGTWAGIAIHDVSSVVGAATAFGGDAVQTATAVKLSRVLYLVPIVLIAALWLRRESGSAAKGAIPWFIGGFLIASVVRTTVPELGTYAGTVKAVASTGFAAALFLIGCGISRATLKAVGVRPMVQGAVLWLFISVAALVAVKAM